MLISVKQKHAEIAAEIYNIFGNSAFTPNQLYKACGHRKFHGFIIVEMKRRKQIIEIDREYFRKEDTWVSTYRLSKDMIVWLERNEYITSQKDDANVSKNNR